MIGRGSLVTVTVLAAVAALAPAPVLAAEGDTYYLTNARGGGTADETFRYGRDDDEVVVGDWDGDGGDTLGVRRGNTFVLSNNLGRDTADVVVAYGRATDEVVVGDWDGDGGDTVGVRRGNVFHLANRFTGGDADVVVAYGRATDEVVVGDWDGDGRDTLGVRRGNRFFLTNTLGSGFAQVVVAFGRDSDDALSGDWDGDGRDTLGVRRGATFHLSDRLTAATAGTSHAFGRAGDGVLVGDWDADGTDTVGVRRARRAARLVAATGWSRFATVGGVTLAHPSARVERVAFHESNHDGARQLEVAASAVRPVTMASRGRGTGSRTAADVVVDPAVEIRSPVTGTVVRAGTYVLYCRYSDDFAVVEPDAHPGWEVKVLHIDGVRVRPGDRVTAGATVIAAGPTPLPFRSQVDDHTAEPSWPHVHIEVVDPSVPDRPGRGC